jgi:hypothetical protein
MFPKVVRREILLLLAAKAAALTVIYFVFFSPTEKSVLSPHDIEAHLFFDTAHQDGRNGHR